MLTTKRLFLRPLELEDSEPFYDYRSDKIVNKYQGFIPTNIAEINAFINEQPKQFNIPHTWFQLGIEHKATRKLIGDIGIQFRDEENNACMLGCTLAKQYQRQGFAYEALQAVIRLLFQGLVKEKILAFIHPKNIASIRLFERLQFVEQPHLRERYIHRGKERDDLVYKLLRTDWIDH